jgi:hypothetical protein
MDALSTLNSFAVPKGDAPVPSGSLAFLTSV